VQGNESTVGEPTAIQGGGLVFIASNSLSERYTPLGEARYLGHKQFQSPASTHLIQRPTMPPFSDSTQPICEERPKIASFQVNA
jgi:hypothetical protein